MKLKKDRLKKGGKEFYASPVAGDGKVYVVDRSGRLTVLKAAAEWEELSSADFGEDDRRDSSHLRRTASI